MAEITLDADFEPDFDVIVVGGGCAGCVAAYTLAEAGKAVLVVERGNYSGAKNMTGGRIYTHSLAQVFPDYLDAPLQRKVAHERISLMAPDSNFTVDFTSRELTEQGQESWTVLRAPFDQWLAEKAEEAGAEIIPGIAVEDLLISNGKVVGISAAGEEMTAKMVILADGVNSLLTQKAGLTTKPAPAINEVAVGAKETIQLDPETIESRFLCNPGEGASWLFAGSLTNGAIGGAFIYTNEDTVSVGIVATMSEVIKHKGQNAGIWTPESDRHNTKTDPADRAAGGIAVISLRYPAGAFGWRGHRVCHFPGTLELDGQSALSGCDRSSLRPDGISVHSCACPHGGEGIPNRSGPLQWL